METIHTKVKCCKETIYGLTFGKNYDVIEEDFMFFKIIDDNGKSIRITKDNFWDASQELKKKTILNQKTKAIKTKVNTNGNNI